MRFTRHHRRPRNAMVVNLTPMVDVIFLLTIFFMLVSRFSSAEQIPMELPKPEDSQADVARLPERVLINCRPADLQGEAVLYSIGPNSPEPLDVIASRLVSMKAAMPRLQVVVRADRRIRYADVRAVMRIIAGAGIEILNVVAHVDESK